MINIIVVLIISPVLLVVAAINGVTKLFARL